LPQVPVTKSNNVMSMDRALMFFFGANCGKEAREAPAAMVPGLKVH
jgi:hypothetical protein